MARGELSWREVRDDDFPYLCLRCGALPCERVPKTFRWMPWWKPLVAVPLGVFLVPFGAVPLVGKTLYRTLISKLATPQEMLVGVPICPAHRHHWRWRQSASWGGLIALGVAVVAAELLVFSP